MYMNCINSVRTTSAVVEPIFPLPVLYQVGGVKNFSILITGGMRSGNPVLQVYFTLMVVYMALLVLKAQAFLALRNAFPLPRWGGLRDKPRERLLGVSTSLFQAFR